MNGTLSNGNHSVRENYEFPSFDALPRVPGTPQGCLWGYYDKNGQKDELGSLNLLTSSVVREARSEIRSGRHVQLDWPLESIQKPGFDRRPMHHVVINNYTRLKEYALDDELEMNTQTGSHWDSLRHYAYQKGQLFYNAVSFEEAKSSNKMGIQNWCKRGGIVGRGILVDMVRYFKEYKHIELDAWSTVAISSNDLDAALAAQGTIPRQGDILIIRSGYIKRYGDAKDTPDQPTEDMVRWLYRHHFAALAGDAVAFEAWPRNPNNPWSLHEWALVWWGTPLGELWDLEGLSQVCEEEGRWSFFITSAPLNVDGEVGSPAGAIAVF
ncbi:hypothetical protein LCI18_005291 [Fusarium solani-melongenae]|uniref:Uncharacterized protein n=1 Tax=Fusarium solani subsp. cucurbitae TaxID=2747967 RepID=A0ACD3Z0E3_FUSSC|nr:hypothetical protein LCI18_005291 [Fusarium solani-melongenae]